MRGFLFFRLIAAADPPTFSAVSVKKPILFPRELLQAMLATQSAGGDEFSNNTHLYTPVCFRP